MKLRRKAILALAVFFIALITILNIVSWVFFLNSYKDLEEDEALQEASRTMDAFDENLDGISATTKDWAYWDDSYAFVVDGNQAFIDDNLTPWVFENLGLNAIIYVDTAGDIVYGEGYDLQEEEKAPLPAGLEQHLTGDSPLLRPGTTGEGMAGVILLPEYPLLTAAEPIMTSSGEGPPHGTLIMGRFLDDMETEKLAVLARQDVKIVPFDDGSQSPPYREAGEALAAGEGVVVRTSGSDSISAYALIEDVYGDPALILEMTMPRSIYRQGVNTLTYFVIFVSVAALVFGLLILLLLERIVLARLSQLTAEIDEIGRTGDPATRVQVRGRDELASLASSINTTLDKLEHSEERFQALTDNALDMIVIIDADGNVLYESPAVDRSLAFGSGFFVGRNAFEMVHPEDYAKVMDALARVLAAPGAIEQVDLRYPDESGSWRHLEVTGYNLLEDAAVGGIVVNARDITDRVLAEQRLEEINRLFQSLAADPRENIQIIMRGSRELLGVAYAAYSRLERGRYYIATTEPGKKGFRTLDDPDGYISFDVIVQDLNQPVIIGDIAAEGLVDSSPMVARHGCTFFVGYPVILNQRTVGCLSLYDTRKRDFTVDEMETLSILARAIAVEEERISYNESIKDFVDITSHELRHPITLMKGYALTLRDYADRLDNERRLEFLNIINEAADRLDMMTRELLDVSRIERERFQLNRRMVGIDSIVEHVVKEMEESWREWEFVVSEDATVQPRLIDAEKIARALVILLDNACEHSSPGSTVEVRLEEWDGEARISIIDSGVGVPEGEEELIFERFYQVADTEHSSARGLGLGLYIAREIVLAHGGRIWYEPREGGGSIFTFTLP